MSIEADPVEHEVSMQDLLREIVMRLDILIRHSEENTDEKFTQEDIIILGDLNVIFTRGPSINTHTHDKITFKS
jgi:hypothetical protein